MKTRDLILNALGDLKTSGYEQVSVSEIAHKTRITERKIVATLHKAGIKTAIRRGERFVTLVEMQAIAPVVYFSALPLKSAIFEAD